MESSLVDSRAHLLILETLVSEAPEEPPYIEVGPAISPEHTHKTDQYREFHCLFDRMYRLEEKWAGTENLAPTPEAIERARSTFHEIARSYDRLPDRASALADGVVIIQYGDSDEYTRFEFDNDGSAGVVFKKDGRLHVSEITSSHQLDLYITHVFTRNGTP